MASHGSDTPTSTRAILHHTDTILCTFMHTTVLNNANKAISWQFQPCTFVINAILNLVQGHIKIEQ